MLSWPHYTKHIRPKLLIGDWLVVIFGLYGVILLFSTLWQNNPAAKLQIRQGDNIVGTYTLNQNRTIHVQGPLGESIIQISIPGKNQEGNVRFVQSPCHGQYCVHQGWLKHAGQIAVCLPNQVSIELIGEKKPYDTLNY